MPIALRLSQAWKSFVRTETSEAFDYLALAIASLWFLFNVTLPDIYKGRACCDALGYIDIANHLQSVSDFFTGYGIRTLGYPLFLKAHLWLVSSVGLQGFVDGVTLSLFTAFVLHIVGSFFLYSAVRAAGIAVPREGLWLLLIHPGLVSHAALPLTDGFVTTLGMFAVGCMIYSRSRKKGNWKWAAVTGFLLGWMVLTRPAHYSAALLTMIVWVLIDTWRALRARTASIIILPLVCVLLFAGVTAARHYQCYVRDHRLCIFTVNDRDYFLGQAIAAEQHGMRTYAVNYLDDDGQLKAYVQTVDDPFTIKNFPCLPAVNSVQTLLHCYGSSPFSLPLLIAKKMIALFDNYALNTYALWITALPHVLFNRLFGLFGIVGFTVMAYYFFGLLRPRHLSHPILLPILYTLLYAGFSLIPSTDSRYGFPLVPLSIFFFVSGMSTMTGAKHHHRLLATLAFLVIMAFVVQTYVWDLADPLLQRGLS